MQDPEYRRLGDTGERMVRLVRDKDQDGAVTIWRSLTIREQQMIALSFARMISLYRAQLGHPRDAEYGPDG